jgi:hypothetical protein
MDYMFYVGQVTWTISLLYGIGVILFVNSIKNGVMNVYVIVIEMFITFKGAKNMQFAANFINFELIFQTFLPVKYSVFEFVGHMQQCTSETF